MWRMWFTFVSVQTNAFNILNLLFPLQVFFSVIFCIAFDTSILPSSLHTMLVPKISQTFSDQSKTNSRKAPSWVPIRVVRLMVLYDA